MGSAFGPVSARSSLAAALALLFIAPRSHADVLTVDAQGGADFTEVQAAVDAAGEGDTILVRSGTYASVEVHAKSLAIVAGAPGEVRLGSIAVRDLAEGQQVLLSGLEARRETLETRAALVVRGVRGVFRAQDCTFAYAPSTYASGVQGPGAFVESCEDVAFTRCRIEGERRDGTTPDRLAAGLVARFSRVSLFECEVFGAGDLYYYCYCQVPDAGHGCVALASTLYASATRFQGGHGGDGECGTFPGDGGDGLHLERGSRAYTLQCELVGGFGGLPPLFCGPWGGHAGDPLFLGGGSTCTELPGEPRSVRAAAALPAGEPARLELHGLPGDQVFLHGSAEGGLRYLLDHSSVLLIGGPVELPGLPLGTIPESGVMLAVVQPESLVPPGVSQIHLQPSFVGSGGEGVLGNPLHVIRVGEPSAGFCERPVHVDADAPPGGDGARWATAFDSIEFALVRAEELLELPYCPLSGIQVWIAEGTYVPNGGVDASFKVTEGMELYGGFAGTELSLDERDPELHPTVLSGDRNGDDGPGFLNYADNCETVVEIRLTSNRGDTRPCVIDGFTVRGGTGRTSEAGGGVRVQAFTSSMARIEDCKIVENRARTGGGLYGSTKLRLELVRCLLADNRAEQRGGGAFVAGQGRLSQCVFENNLAGTEGGGLWISSSSLPVISNSLFARNGAQRGGGVRLDTSPAIHPLGSFFDSTFYRNRAEVGAAGIDREDVYVQVANSIFWANETAGLSGEEQQIAFANGPPVEIDHCCVQGWTGAHGGLGNHGLDPLLLSGGRLAAGSPCIDAGSNALVPLDELDLDGDGWVHEPLTVDLVGRRRFADDPDVPDAPGRTAPVVDMGALERRP